MEAEKCSLYSKDFELNAPKTFIQLWKDMEFTDVTLATVDDQQIKAITIQTKNKNIQC